MLDQEAGTGHATPSSANMDAAMTKAEIAQLGRVRPAIFKSLAAEIAFVLTVVGSMMMSEFFISGFNIILPPTAEDLHIKESARTWPASAINIATAALLLPFSRLCDMYGGRWVFLGGHSWMCVWTLICGFSVNPEMLIICRAMQGIGAAAFVPAGLALLGQTYRPGPRKNLVFSIWGALACVGFYIGIFIGAVTADFITWRWFFWIGSIIVFGLVVSGWFSIPPTAESDKDKTLQMDWLGIITIVPGLVLIVFAFTEAGQAPQGWKTPYIYVTLILSVLFLAGAVYVQGWVSKQPLLPPALFKPKYMKRLTLMMFCAYGIFGLFLFYSSFYMETVLHNSPIQTAAWFTPLAVGGMVLAIGGGFVMHAIPNTVLMIISCCGYLLSVILFALIPEDQSNKSFLYWAYVFPSMLGGTIGVDITFNITNVFITTAMPRKLQASASGLINSLLYLGISFWLGVGEMAVSLAKEKQGDDLPLRAQYQIGFWLGVALAGIMLALTLTVRLGQAESTLTADELAQQELEQDMEDERAKENRNKSDNEKEQEKEQEQK